MAASDETYKASPVKRHRRSKAELESVQKALYEEIRQGPPYTVRQAYYQMSVQGVVPKTDPGYDLVQRELLKMRRAGKLPHSWVADSTRWMRKDPSYSNIKEALVAAAQAYRRSLWNEAPVYVEIWCEKDALAGILSDVTIPYDVPLMVSRGFSSAPYLYSTGMHAARVGKPCYYYYFGDHDPSGVLIPKKVEEGITEFAPHAEIHFERVAVNEDQIRAWNLPTRPTKKTDSRAKTFVGESCELDAVPPALLRELARDCIERHIPPERLARLKRQEEEERATWLEAFSFLDKDAS
ncbi:hypothetical protein [Deinococcus fonticola]|uniref:hypothetical protein n=1 Tax=Deinococcus fonticola TaxID=2528713 RepID=UPI0010754960|nr:hypothetical protein [Deinococcus fonticola]